MAIVQIRSTPDLDHWQVLNRKHDVIVVGARDGRVLLQTWIGNKLMKQEEFSLREAAVIASYVSMALERELVSMERASEAVTRELTRG